MKKILLLTTLLLSATMIKAQFSPHINISSDLYSATTPVFADIDSDGKEDIVVATYPDILWFKSLDLGQFGPHSALSKDGEGSNAVIAADLDNDGDSDILSATRLNKIVWYENLDSGIFSIQQIISSEINYGVSVDAVDIDNDGDLDVLSASRIDNKIAWYENKGKGIFGSQNIISANAISARFVISADLDNDGDSDVLSASSGDNKIAWYENENKGAFGPEQILSSNAMGAISVYSSDLDNDGDLDVLSASSNDNKLAWYENLGGGIFNSENVISLSSLGAASVFASDLDDDGLNDVIGASAGNRKIVWHRNLGNGSFEYERVITNTEHLQFVNSVMTHDIDNDGDLDILSTTDSTYFTVAWYENYRTNPGELTGKIFFDENQNGVIDTNEIGLSQFELSLQPDDLLTYSKTDGGYNFRMDNGRYNIRYIPNPIWQLTTDSSTYTRSINTDNVRVDSLNFGFYPDTLLTVLDPDLTGGFPRCHDSIFYWIKVANQGTTTPKAIIHLRLDDSIKLKQTYQIPDSIIGQNIYWSLQNIGISEEMNLKIKVSMPGQENPLIVLKSKLFVHELDVNDNIVYTIEDSLLQVVLCAYDPNDKVGFPFGDGQNKCIPAGQQLEYTVRFQNTGTDTAFNVMIRDRLDSDLDRSTFKPIGSSHSMSVNVEADGEVVFLFENIMLPDSNVNKKGSQGFAKFAVQAKYGITPNAYILNTAHIYFDHNPAVLTNTVYHTIDSSEVSSTNYIDGLEKQNVMIFPNPFKTVFTISFIKDLTDTYDLYLYNVSGRTIFEERGIETKERMFDIPNLGQGIFIVMLRSSSGEILFTDKLISSCHP